MQKRPQALAASKDETDEAPADSWYFAIGAMMNPTSLAGRQLSPKASVPALLLDFRLEFLGKMGMASATPAPGESFHGVLHRMAEPDMVRLDAIEAIYDRCPARCRLYDGGEQECTVYSMSPEKLSAHGPAPYPNFYG